MADPIYTSASPIAVNPANGELIGGATFTVHAPDDTSFSTPLAVTDPNTGVAINPLRSNSNGTLPAFKVAGDLPRVKLKSGGFVTELVSLGGLVVEQVAAAGLDPETVSAAIAAAGTATTKAGEASASATAAADAATIATQKASAIENVPVTNDGIMANVAADEESAFAAQLKAKIAEEVDRRAVTVNAADHGLSPDASAAANSAAMEAAFAAMPDGGTLYVPPLPEGERYAISDPIDLRGKSFRLNARGSRFVRTSGESGTAAFSLGGALPATPIATATAAIPVGALTVPVSSSAGFQPGDMIRINSSGEVFSADRPTVYFKGELAEVATVPNGTSITVMQPIQDSYSITGHTVTVRRIDAVSVEIDGLTVDQDAFLAGTRIAHYGIFVSYVNKLRVYNTAARNFRLHGFSVYNGRDVLVDGHLAEDCYDPVVGYGIEFSGCDGATAVNCIGRRNRHTIDIGGDAFSGPNRHIKYDNVVAYYDLSAGISTHGDCEDVTIVNCKSMFCGGGMITRGRKTTITNNTIIGARAGYGGGIIRLGEGNFADGNAAIDLVFANNVVDLSSVPTSMEVGYVFIPEDVRNARITGNIFLGGTTQTCMHLRSRVIAGLHVSGNYFGPPRRPGQSDQQFMVIEGYTLATAEQQSGIEITQNTFDLDPAVYSRAIDVQGGISAATATADVTITQNVFNGGGVFVGSASRFTRGTIRVTDNQFAWAEAAPGAATILHRQPQQNPAVQLVTAPNIFRNGAGSSYRTAVPVSSDFGFFPRGHMIWNSEPSPGAALGWVCTQGGYNAPLRVTSAAVSVGDRRRNSDGGQVYVCVTAGTTASSGGLTGTGTGIVDGTAVWDYLGPNSVFKAAATIGA